MIAVGSSYGFCLFRKGVATMHVSHRFIAAVKLADRPAYLIAHESGLTRAALKAVDRKVERLRLALWEVAKPHTGKRLALRA